MTSIIKTNATSSIAKVSPTPVFFCGGGPEVDLRLGELHSASKNKANLLDRVKKLKDKDPLEQLVLSSGQSNEPASEVFNSIDKGVFTLADGSTVSVTEVAKFAINAGVLKKDGSVVLNARVYNQSDAAYKAMSQAAKAAGVTVVTLAKDEGGVYLFKPDGSVEHNANGVIKSAIGLRGGCGGGYKSNGE